MTAEDCCNKDPSEQFELASVLGVSTASTSSSTTATETRTSTPTGSSQQSSTATGNQEEEEEEEEGNGGLGTNGKIGMGVGIGVGIPFVIGALVAVFLYRKKRHSPPVLAPSHRTKRYLEKPELDGNATVAELDASNRTRPVEVEA